MISSLYPLPSPSNFKDSFSKGFIFTRWIGCDQPLRVSLLHLVPPNCLLENNVFKGLPPPPPKKIRGIVICIYILYINLN